MADLGRTAGLDDEADEGGPDEATLAFQTLTGEVADTREELALVRRALEALGSAVKAGRSPDYSPTLGTIAQNVHALASRVDAIEKHTAAKLSPEAYEREMGRTRESVLRPFRDGLESARREVIEAAVSLRDAVGVVREQRDQGRRLFWTAMGGVTAGLVAFPLVLFPLARWLPGASDALALAALGQNGWDAGVRLMETANPASWRKLVEIDAFMRAAGDDLKSCEVAAARAGKDQRCTFTVKAPASPQAPAR